MNAQKPKPLTRLELITLEAEAEKERGLEYDVYEIPLSMLFSLIEELKQHRAAERKAKRKGKR